MILKSVLPVLMFLLVAAQFAYAGRRMDAIGTDLEGIIVDPEVNGVDVDRNPANLTLIDKTEASIDMAGPGTSTTTFINVAAGSTATIQTTPVPAASPYIFNFVMSPINKLTGQLSLTYGNSVTNDTWQLTPPSTSIPPTGPFTPLSLSGSNGIDDDVLVTENSGTAATYDDWSKKITSRGTREFANDQGKRLNVGAAAGYKLNDKISLGVRAALETNDDGRIKENASYNYTVTAGISVPAGANEDFSGARTLEYDGSVSTAPTAIRAQAGTRIDLAEILIDASAGVRLKSGKISEAGTARDGIDLDPDKDNKLSNQDWIGTATYLGANGVSGTETIERNYSGDIKGMDIGAFVVPRKKIAKDITAAGIISFMSLPYSYTQSRSDKTTIAATAKNGTGGATADNVYSGVGETTDTLQVDYACTGIGAGAGLNVRKLGVDFGIGVRATIYSIEETQTDGANKITTAESNVSNVNTGYLRRTTTTTNATGEVKTVTKTDATIVALPIGFEVSVTSGLVIRAGLRQVWVMAKTGVTETTTTNPTESTTVTDGASVTVKGSQTRTEVTNDLPETSGTAQYTYYTLGIGWQVIESLMLDVVTTGDILNINNIRASATWIF